MVICIMGRSGSGKTKAEEFLENELDFRRVISMTTRHRRDRETNGIDYFFVTLAEFKESLDDNSIMEYTEYQGNLYGTPVFDFDDGDWVCVVDERGFKSIKEYAEANGNGQSVVGVYIRVSKEIAMERALLRIAEDASALWTAENALEKLEEALEKNTAKVIKRVNNDDVLFDGIESRVDFVVNGEQEMKAVFMDIEKIYKTLV